MKIDRLEIIRLLTVAGHSASKALEIAIDAERGDPYAKAWVRQARTHA
jgi:hypothetical protein